MRDKIHLAKLTKYGYRIPNALTILEDPNLDYFIGPIL